MRRALHRRGDGVSRRAVTRVQSWPRVWHRVQALVRWSAAAGQRIGSLLDGTHLFVGGLANRRGRGREVRRLREQAELLGPIESGPDPITVITAGITPGTRAPSRQVVGAALLADLDTVRVPSDDVRDLDAAVRSARGTLVAVVHPGIEPIDLTWPERLASAITRDGYAAAVPMTVHPLRSLRRATPHDARVRARGLGVVIDAEGRPVVEALGAGTVPELSELSHAVFGTDHSCVMFERATYERAGGLSGDDLDTSMIDLCIRLRAQGGVIGVIPAAAVFDHRPIRSLPELDQPIAPQRAGWCRIIDEHGPTVRRSAIGSTDDRLHIAITCGAPSMKIAHRWGDWHFASALARAFERSGYVVRVQTADHANDLAGRACDLHIVLRGLAPVRRTSGQAHALWIISHPELIDDDECEAADIVFVSSSWFAASLRGRTSTPVHVLLQASDTTRFVPDAPKPGRSHDIVVVAKTREIARSAVVDAIAAGLRPAIYGSGWDELIDPSLIVADYIDNADLPGVYASSAVVLNDHWDSMRESGFVSNRIFDVLACGTPVVSDSVVGLEEIFGDIVPTYSNPAELREIVDQILADPQAARARAERGRRLVFDHHSFDARAATILHEFAEMGLIPPR